MTKYFTRVKKYRVYAWKGRPSIKDRKLLNLHYGGLDIKSEGTGYITVTPGDFVLIEGENEERPFVAKLQELYDDGNEKHTSKHAIVQWFLRYEEVPYRKRALLGREPHQQEIFLYDVPSCENDIDAETIIGRVEVTQLKPEDSFPVQKDAGSLFVKLSWNGKAFKPLTSNVCHNDGVIAANHDLEDHNSLPKPLFYPLEGDIAESKQITRSASRGQKNEAEVESRHSASKSSHCKERGVQRVSTTSTPGARKKLQLSSPTKSGVPGLEQKDNTLDKEFKILESIAPKRKVAFSGIPDSPPKKVNGDTPRSTGILPLKGNTNSQTTRHSLRLTPMRRPLEQLYGSLPKDQSLGKICIEANGNKAADNERPVKSKTPQKLEPTPKKSTSRPSKRSEEDFEEEPQTPRSRRTSARMTANKVRAQLKALMDSDEDVDEDKDFVPIKETCTPSDSEEENEQEQVPLKRNVKKGCATPRTPTSSRKASSRTPNKTPNSKTPHSATPRIPERNQPVKKPSNMLEEARIRLHVSAVPESLPCREQEYQDVYNFVESKLLDGTGGCMYISGVPGTGKTATVHEVIRSLQESAEEEELPSFQYIEINGMKLTDPHQAYVQILKLLTGQKATADHAAALLEKRFSTPASKKETTVLLVDELDLLWTRKQNVMYSLFDWPTRKHAKLIVLAIANTMDLPERIMMNRVASRLGLTRMSFQPYTHKQLQQIITSRLNHIKAFGDDAIQLVARKVAALSGDARRCLDICRRATEICEFSCKMGDSSLVKMSHVMEALEEMFSSPYVTAIRNSSLMEQTFLRAVIAEFRRSGLEEATFQQIYRQHVVLCRIEGLQPPLMSETMAVCHRLGASRLLLVESSRNDLHLRVRINVSQDDIMYALKEE
ncbi:hypothetical protein XENTR_v10012047 [Xenopus tropicalis]|uniref:Origin recognition complex subunit 1 n=1 Tax=Xenopus tropicalis TaxID=8364 RepID=B7ZUQ4_XENTR|nr:origin recognition complex subunit 1 isoform X1 [Xenopus tropicalis]AAI71312.1 origin recognition complex, subunit 1-like [Xenopus tropicalis]AAI71314.1 origin recognition complex, subunit 1-like [Xenopus tropicalis]KAE8610209.1 hypothetical protein XENTR_v10012047 [Xenopus tropicalis]KAE8610210.1 hypothetical protein XENTR_v10012047 [Xenopus tropicalis]KAE8610211.1 hypothetical protein XENTR_v10012047 [Xenopus tropicalis]